MFKRAMLIGLALGMLFGYGASEAAESKLKGVAFADYYYFASGAKKKENGFQFRRIYLT
ncbi:MAG: hypothetical protein HOH77_08440, partial [Candidatus Latescibacteria bacterium]|nr:hypothetical protein [Candidatus Latescibacterota bacterium]